MDTERHRPALTRRGLLGAGLAATGTGVVDLAGPDRADAASRGRSRTHRTMARLGMRSGTVHRDGARFRTGGVNAFQLVTNDYPSPRLMSHAQIDALFAEALTLEAGVIRAHTLGASVGNPFTLVTGVSGSGAHPRIHYDPAVWDVIDYAVWRARQAGIYLIAPLVDECGYYNGGKRHWVNFRHPGSVSLDPTVNAANSVRQRSAEDRFYTDRQVTWDFEQYVREWLDHVNPRTGVAFKHEPVLSVVQVGNELWTAAQDAPGWVADKAALIKRVAPTTLVMDSGADGLEVQQMAWSSPHVDILGTHPYSTFTSQDVRRMARFAAHHRKAFAVDEYAWSKADAPALEQVVRTTGNIFTSAPWSLQCAGDRHNAGAPYGSDDVSLYVPGQDQRQRLAVARITAHDRALRRGVGRTTGR